MNGMPFDMLLNQPVAETFQAGGLAPNVLAAHDLAWQALSAMVEEADMPAWTLKVIEHTYYPNPTAPGVQFTATFVRHPDGPESG